MPSTRRPRVSGDAPRVARAQKEKAPTAEPSRLSAAKNEKSRQRPTLPPGRPDSTIGAGGLNGRVRNGNGCDPSAMVTGMKCQRTIDRRRVLFKVVGAACTVQASGRSRGAGPVARLKTTTFFKHYKRYGQASRPISTGKLKALLLLHIGPINLVVCKGSLGRFSCGRRHLEACFTLRCFQRLSQPNLATQLCHWRDNWCTRGSSIPVLSY